MVNFNALRNIIAKYDSDREKLIKKARDVLKQSKQLIYAVHRNKMPEAAKLLVEVRKARKELDGIAKNNRKLFFEGSYSDALQEYVEGVCYYEFVKNNKILGIGSFDVEPEEYLMGISDLTGELGRRAMLLAIKKDFKGVEKIKELVADIHGEFLKFNLRNGQLRKKADSIKYNLKKLEDIMYDIKTKGKK